MDNSPTQAACILATISNGDVTFDSAVEAMLAYAAHTANTKPLPNIEVRVDECFDGISATRYISPRRIETEDDGSFTAVIVFDHKPGRIGDIDDIWHHPDGGQYHREGRRKGKHPDTGAWLDGYDYRCMKTGEPYWTTIERWNERFSRTPTL